MSFCKVEVEHYICTVTVDRPPANAAVRELYLEIRDTFWAIDRRDDIKVVIFTGAGKVFMAGNDLDEFSVFYEPDTCTAQYDIIRNAYSAIKNCRYPVIGAINGAAAGGGCAFAACCDVLVAAENAKFALSEIKVGIIGAEGYASLMVPEKVLRYMAFSGNAVTAQQLHQWGGVWKVVPREQLMDEARALAAEFAANSRSALMGWKACLNRNFEHDLVGKFDNDLRSTIDLQSHHDFREASRAFIEKRLPEFDEQ